MTSSYTQSFFNSSIDSSGVSSLNQSLLAAESNSRNEGAAVGSNCSRECSDGFYLNQDLNSCRPQCGVWELTPSTTGFAISITSVCLATTFVVVVLVIIALQWKT